MEALPAGQPGVPVPGAERGSARARAARAARLTRRLREPLAALAAAALAFHIAHLSGDHLGGGLDVLPGVVLTALAAGALFAVAGYGLTRLLLPAGLRRHEALWVLPVGACACALALTVLGFAFVPFKLSIAVVALAGLALGVHARRHPRPAPPAPAIAGRELAWVAWIAALLAAVALIPLWRAGYMTLVGQGSDAHLAAGTAQFLQHNHPLATNVDEPVDMVPLVWRSKPPIYYVLGATATLTGRPTYAVMSVLAALLLAMAAAGFFLLVRETGAAGRAGALAAMGIVGLDRMVLHTVMHPYYNQTWGFLTLPFAILLAWWTVRHRTRGAVALLIGFVAVGAFAYPLEAPLPLVALAAFWGLDRRERRARGEPVAPLDLRRRLRGRRLWLIPLAIVLVAPLRGVVEKQLSGFVAILDPAHTLGPWGGDLTGYIPEHRFLALNSGRIWLLVLVVLAGFAGVALRRLPRALAGGLVALLVLGVLLVVEFRVRRYGYYFHFKTLAFLAPLLVALAVAGASRAGRLGAVLIAAYALTATSAALKETSTTYDETPRSLLALRSWDRALPRDAPIRLDVTPGAQLWTAYMLADHPLCSRRPLVDTSYPSVPYARRAAYALVGVASHDPERFYGPDPFYLVPPFDSVGPPVFQDIDYALYRLRPGTGGPAGCSRRMVQSVTATPVG